MNAFLNSVDSPELLRSTPQPPSRILWLDHSAFPVVHRREVVPMKTLGIIGGGLYEVEGFSTEELVEMETLWRSICTIEDWDNGTPVWFFSPAMEITTNLPLRRSLTLPMCTR